MANGIKSKANVIKVGPAAQPHPTSLNHSRLLSAKIGSSLRSGILNLGTTQ